MNCPIVRWLDACCEIDACDALIQLGIEKEYGPRHRFALLSVFYMRQLVGRHPI